MSATLTPLALSGATSGKNIKLTATVIGSAQTLHTGPSTSTNFDDVDLYAVNTGSNNETLTICNMGTTSPDDTIPIPMPPSVGPKYLGRFRIPGNASPAALTAFASTTAVLNVYGQVTRYAP